LFSLRLRRPALAAVAALLLVLPAGSLPAAARPAPDGFADLTHARRVAADLRHIADVVEDLALPFGQLFGQFAVISRIVLRDVTGTLAK